MSGGVLEVEIRREGEEGFEEVGIRGERRAAAYASGGGGCGFSENGIGGGETEVVCGFGREGVWVWIDLGEKETTIESAGIEDSCCRFHGETPSTNLTVSSESR